MHIIAAKAVAFGEALKPEFKTYMENVVKNCLYGRRHGGRRSASGIGRHRQSPGFGRPYSSHITGKDAEKLLESVGLTVNKNTIPNKSARSS